jgi:hypothetical protein
MKLPFVLYYTLCTRGPDTETASGVTRYFWLLTLQPHHGHLVTIAATAQKFGYALPIGILSQSEQKRCTLFIFKIMISLDEGKKIFPNSLFCI